MVSAFLYFRFRIFSSLGLLAESSVGFGRVLFSVSIFRGDGAFFVGFDFLG